ncbi:autotransporter outer membrane beta-barrel domain-containing protein [Bosea sp. LC85]|uniref:autotransporter family protein n=1 Tax=Bosea sp. LC85 TaxID=1502851 RepID=UPI001378D7AB|nr:autotransporter outer membrane beta-barrel domain-containing protein [Bosea sp. LC85]
MGRWLRATGARRNSAHGSVSTLVSGLVGLFAALPAQAQCTPDPPGFGATVTCSGTDVDGFAAPANTPVTINVAPGATVQQAPATGQAITFGLNTAGNLLNNNGSIISSGNAAGTFTGVTFSSGTGAGTSILNNFGILSATNAGAGNALAVSLLQGNAASTIQIVNATGATIVGTATGGGTGVGVNQNFAAGATARALVIDNSGIIRGTTNGVAAGTGASSAAQTITINNGVGGAAAQINGGTGAAITFAGNGLNTVNNLATGTINGNIVSTGNASIVIDNSGTINGNINQGNSADTFIMRGGVVNGTLDQGSGLGDGVDRFTMTGGTINGTVNQGGELDFATVSGGVITGGLNEGDFVTVTGGQIGSIDMTLANNVLTMSGGLVVTNVLAAQNNDTLNLSGGRIGGFVNFGNGNNVFNITGGSVGGFLLSGTGTDTVNWSGGGVLESGFRLGAGNDLAIFTGLTAAHIVPAAVIDGGPGIDRLTWNNTSATGVARFTNWELFELTNNSQLTFASTLTLGDAGTGTGTLSIDATSTVFAGNGVHAIAPFTPGQLVTVNNAGTIDLTNGPAAASDSLMIIGNYAGQNARMRLQTVLGDSASPSDQLIISGGLASGQTGITVVNLGGTGALTFGSGIKVVDTLNGATTAAGAFSQAGPIAAGAFEYALYRGGIAAGTEQNWYLRSTLPPPTTVVPQPQLAVGAESAILAPSPGAPTIATPDGPVVALYRPEVATNALTSATARMVALSTLGTFHERQGDQDLLRGTGIASAGWGRIFGQQREQRFSGDVSPEFKGSIIGLQTGLDLYGIDWPSGHRDRFGAFFGYGRAEGDVRGFALGQLRASTGKLGLNSYSLGAYWTHIGPAGWYLDTVLMNSWLDGTPRSDRGIRSEADGTVFTGSLEAGYPIALGGGFVLEPQGQLIWQRTSLDRTRDLFSAISQDSSDALTGRIGARLRGSLLWGTTEIRPYLTANLWRSFGGSDKTLFDTNLITTQRGATAFEIGGGVTAQVTPAVSLYAKASYLTNADSNRSRGFGGNLGLRVTW